MKTKVVVVGLIVLLGCVVVGVLRNRQPGVKAVFVKAPPATAPVKQALAPSAPTEAAPLEPAAPAEIPQPAKKDLRRARPQVVVNNPVQQPPANQQQRQLQDPDARIALAFVGEDPEAEAYWMEAIFDSSLPDKERDDLMEDLNEVGFANPDQPGQNDLPLILNRLAIIEQVVPYADDFMTPHLAEAYKDLANMANKAVRD